MLNSTQYWSEYTNAKNKFKGYGSSTANYAQTHASAWSHIAAVWSQMATHMERFENEGTVPSDRANVFRSDTEYFLNIAKGKADAALVYVQIALTNAEMAAVSSHAFVQTVKNEKAAAA